MKVLAPVMVVLLICTGIGIFVVYEINSFLTHMTEQVLTQIVNESPMYRLTDCTPKGQKMLSSAFSGKLGSYGSSTDDKGNCQVQVGKSDWHAARVILKELAAKHPKDFFKEAAAPTEQANEGLPNLDSGDKPQRTQRGNAATEASGGEF